MRLVVADTGPILHLGEAQAMDLLDRVGEVHIPEAVDEEIQRYVSGWSTQRPNWIIVDALAPSAANAAVAWQHAGLLDAGEAAAIALARQLAAEWLLTDDAARLFADSLGLEVHGSLGVVLWSAAHGHLNRADAEEYLDRLSRSTLWISARVLAEARAALLRLSPP